jgi:hypothetical protein
MLADDGAALTQMSARRRVSRDGWVLRPKGVAVRELLGVIPDVLRLLRLLIADRSSAGRHRMAGSP